MVNQQQKYTNKINNLQLSAYQRMSIYSGFATRQQQQSYDQLVEDIIFVLQKRIFKFYNKQTADENKFLDVLIQLHQQMAKMEQNKYLQPRTSKSIQDLLRFLLKNISQFDHVQETKNSKMSNLNQLYNATPASKDIKLIDATAPMLKNQKIQQSTPIQSRLKSHRQSLSKLNEPSSIGKIIKQFQNDVSNQNQRNNSLADSRNTFINQNKINNNNKQNTKHNKNNILNVPRLQTPSAKNPQDNQQLTNGKKEMKNNFTQIQFKSRFKSKDSNQSGAKDLVLGHKSKGKIGVDYEKNTRDHLLEYLQKNNKNYLRGYRKRQVKTRAYSKQYSAI